MVTNVNFEISKDGSFVCLVEKVGSPLFELIYSLL